MINNKRAELFKGYAKKSGNEETWKIKHRDIFLNFSVSSDRGSYLCSTISLLVFFSSCSHSSTLYCSLYRGFMII